MRGGAPLSLKGRAIALLAQREHSRSELRAKLTRHVQKSEGASVEEIEPVLDWLEQQGHLSDRRFCESRVRVRAPRHGAERIRQELARHGVRLEPQALQALRDTEFARASDVWQRKFGASSAEGAPDAHAKARQARFLAQRGFASDVIVRVIRGLDAG